LNSGVNFLAPFRHFSSSIPGRTQLGPTRNLGGTPHRDRFARFGAECGEAALAASGRRLLVVDPGEVDEDLVPEVTEILTSQCARRYGRPAAASRAARALAAMEADGG